MQIKGGIAVGEASSHAAKASARLNGHPRPILIANIVAAVVGIGILIAFSVIQSLADLPGWLFLPVMLGAIVVGTLAGLKACRVWAVRFARKALAVRGMVDPVSIQFSATDEGLVSITGRVEIRAPWIAVSDLFPIGPYWVVLVDAWPLYLPKRFFASLAEEKAFIATILERMGSEAKARSADAVRFASA